MASFYSLGELILITPDLSSISIGFDTTDAFESRTITVAENKLTTTGANFGNIEENIYVNSSSDGCELLVKDGYKIKYVEYPKTVGNGGTLYKPGTTFNLVRDSTKTTYITIEVATSKVSIDLTTLTGWDNVTSGEHQISVVAKATGYLDSEKSTAVSFTRAVINPTYQVVQGTLPQSALSISSDNKNDLPTTTSANQQVKNIFDNYNTMNFSDILSTLMVDTSVLKQDQNKNEVDLTKCEKLTDTCSIFFVKDGNKKYYDYTDNINLEVVNINSSNLTEASSDNTYCVVIEVDTGILNLFSFSDISNDTGNITTNGNNILGVAFLISKKQNVLLEAGTYQFIETLKSNTELDIAEPINCKVNTLTSNDTYGDMSESGVFNISVINTESNPLELDIAGETIEVEIVYQDNSWVYMSSSGNYTATDTSKLRTIVLETDQYVSQEFYDWAITQGNLVKVEQSTGETWVMNSQIETETEFNANISFKDANGNSYSNIIGARYTEQGEPPDGAYGISFDDSYVYNTSGSITGWHNEAYRTITFLEAPTGNLLTWLQANGTKQGGTTTAHKLTWSDQYSYAIAITVNGNEITSPYTLQNGDVIKVPTLTKTTINGVSYSTFDESTLNISGEDITIARTGAEKTTSPVPYITINYTE